MSGDVFRPDYFMDEDVVLVTFNYRLGVFGLYLLVDSVFHTVFPMRYNATEVSKIFK
jgi:carboxylesterase type B